MLQLTIYIVLLFGSSVFIAAQADETDAIETMVVTASRTPTPANLVGSTFTIIEQDVLEQRQLYALSEILRDVPGFAVSRGGVLGSATQIRVRGAEGSHVLVFIDGIEANDPAQNSEYNFAHLSASEVERVEVIRGPQSALWGSDALAGVINIRTRRGSGPLTLSGFAEGGYFGTKHGGGSISAGGDNYHFNIGGSYIKSTGDNISRKNDEDDGYENGTFTFTADYSPAENFTIDIAGRHDDVKNEFDPVDFFITGLPVDGDDKSKTTQDYGRIQSKLILFDGVWSHTAGISLTSTDNDNFSAGLEKDSNRGKKYKIDYQTSLYLDTSTFTNIAHIFTFAFEHEIEEFTQRGPVTIFGDDPNQDLDIATTSYIGEYRANISEMLSLSASVRHDNNSDFRDSTTYRMTAAVLLSGSNTRLHASYGTGVKNPTFIDRFGFYAASVFFPFIGNPDLKPERSRGWEIGIEQFLLDDRITLNVVYFDEKLDDEINGFFFDTTTFNTTAINEDGTSKRNGVELTARIILSDGLTFSGNYTWLDARQPDGSGGEEKEVRRPEHTANLNLNYHFAENRANLNFNVNYSGKQSDYYFPPPAFFEETVTLDSFTLVNLSASYRVTDAISLYSRVENMLNESYEEIYGYRSPGIGVYAGVKMTLKI